MKKFIAAMLALMLCLSLAACSNTPANEGEGEGEKEVLTMGTNAEFPPYEYIEGDKIVGIDAEIAEAIADKLGMDLKIENMEFDAIIPSITSGKVNVGLAGMTVTDERKESVNFSSSYATGIQVVIVKEDADFTVDDLFAKKADGSLWTVGVQTGTTGDLYSTWDLEEPEDDDGNALEPTGKVERYSKGADAVQALIAGKVDCVVIDNEPAKAFVAANSGLKILETEYALEEYAIAVSKDNEDLLNKINEALESLIADGSIDKIVNKYINAD